MGHGHDDWFRHDATEMAPQEEHGGHVHTGTLAMTMVITTFGVIATILLLVMYFQQYTTQLRAEKQEGIFLADNYLAYRSQTEGAMRGSARWIDRNAGTVRLPIDRAMQAVVAEYERYPRAVGTIESQAVPADTDLVWMRTESVPALSSED